MSAIGAQNVGVIKTGAVDVFDPYDTPANEALAAKYVPRTAVPGLAGFKNGSAVWTHIGPLSPVQIANKASTAFGITLTFHVLTGSTLPAMIAGSSS